PRHVSLSFWQSGAGVPLGWGPGVVVSAGRLTAREVPMRPDTEQSYRQRILRVLVYLQQHLDEPLPLEDLARVACFSPYHFHRVFRGMVGESVKEHVRRLRLERAAQRLTATGPSVVATALD